MEAIFIDSYGSLPSTKHGYKYILCSSPWWIQQVSETIPITQQTTFLTIDKIFGHYIPHLKRPKRIVTDHGTPFTTKIWKERLEKEGTTHTLISIQHPQANMVERVNGELSKFFKILLDELRHSSRYGKIQINEDNQQIFERMAPQDRNKSGAYS